MGPMLDERKNYKNSQKIIGDFENILYTWAISSLYEIVRVSPDVSPMNS